MTSPIARQPLLPISQPCRKHTYIRAASFSEDWPGIYRGESVEEERGQTPAESGRHAGAGERGTMAGSAGSPQCNFARMVHLLPPRGLLPGISSCQSLRLRVRKSVSEAAPQSAFARHCQVLGPSCVRETWCTASFRGKTFRELMVNSVGKPDARKGPVRFDERGRETGSCCCTRNRALPRLYANPAAENRL